MLCSPMTQRMASENIALAAAIWPNNGRDPIFEIDIDLIGKGLEAMGFK